MKVASSDERGESRALDQGITNCGCAVCERTQDHFAATTALQMTRQLLLLLCS